MLFYDFEVFKEDWLVVIMDMTNKKEHIIINDADKLEAVYNPHVDFDGVYALAEQHIQMLKIQNSAL